jgi:hypothetical protein
MLAKTHGAAVHGMNAPTINPEDVANCDIPQMAIL